MKRLIIVFITWMLVGVTVTAAWAAGPAKPVIVAEMLNDILKEVEIGIDFDAELFEQTVDSITVDSNELLTFHLAGGISLPEKIREKGRCYQA